MRSRNALFEAFEIGQHQFRLDGLGIADWVDLVVDVLDIVVLKTAQHVDDRVHFADIAEELIAQPFALARPADQARDIDKAELGRDDLLATGNRRQFVQPRIGHADIADVRFNRAERIVGRLRRLRLGQRIEQSGLADIRQSDDTAFETHDGP